MLNHHLCELDEAAADVKDGRAEITIRKLCTFTRTCLIDAGLKKCFWSSIMDCVVHTVNRTYSRRAGCIPYSKLTGLRPNVSYFRQPGSIALYHIQDRYRQKLDERAFVGIFIGYDTAHRSWVFLTQRLEGKYELFMHGSSSEVGTLRNISTWERWSLTERSGSTKQ